MLAKGLRGLLPLVPLTAGGAKREVIEEVIQRLLPAHDTVAKELLSLARLFASLAFDKEDVENQEWIKRRFIVLQDIFRDTPAYQYTLEEGREEERQRHLQTQRNLLMIIVQARFPTLNNLAQKQTAKIKDVKILETVLAGVGTALTLEDAHHALLNWSDTDSN